MRTSLAIFGLCALLFTAPVVFADDAPSQAVVNVMEDPAGAAMPDAEPELSPAAEAIKADPAAVPAAEPVPVDPNLSFLELLFKSIGEMKGASTLAIAAIVIQLLLKLLDLPIVGSWFSGTKGKTKLLIVSGLTFALAPISLRLSVGLDWGAAFAHSGTLAALMVFINQIYVQFVKKDS